MTYAKALKTASLTCILFFLCAMKTLPAFQKDADIIRLQHLVHYASLIEGYKLDTGSYPLETGTDDDTYVFVVNKQQSAPKQSKIPAHFKVIAFQDFIHEIEKTKGKEVKELYDPQYAPDYKPNFYIYSIKGGTYNFAIHVHQPFSFAQRIDDFYYKIGISNVPNHALKIWSPFALFENESFQKELSKTPIKPLFFEEREKLHLKDSKL